MSAKRPITFGDVLDLLGRGDTEVTLNYGDDNITGAASCKLWSLAEDRLVAGITPTGDGLDVWLITDLATSKKDG